MNFFAPTGPRALVKVNGINIPVHDPDTSQQPGFICQEAQTRLLMNLLAKHRSQAFPRDGRLSTKVLYCNGHLSIQNWTLSKMYVEGDSPPAQAEGFKDIQIFCQRSSIMKTMNEKFLWLQECWSSHSSCYPFLRIFRISLLFIFLDNRGMLIVPWIHKDKSWERQLNPSLHYSGLL